MKLVVFELDGSGVNNTVLGLLEKVRVRYHDFEVLDGSSCTTNGVVEMSFLHKRFQTSVLLIF